VLPDQNAVLLSGTLDAIDALREVIGLLDRPSPMVSVELRVEDCPITCEDEWGTDLEADDGAVSATARGNAPAGGPQFRWNGLTGHVAAVDRTLTNRARPVTAASVTTLNGSPALVRFGEAISFTRTRVAYDEQGNRLTQTEVWVVFIGLELLVVPRISGEDWVTLLMRPTLTEWVGEVDGRDGTMAPVTRTSLVETTVRVRSGDSLVLAGWGRVVRERVDGSAGVLGSHGYCTASDPAILVSPTIIWPAMTEAGASR
jgi:type II secretory pathway component GspD/PulD (secretin)